MSTSVAPAPGKPCLVKVIAGFLASLILCACGAAPANKVTSLVVTPHVATTIVGETVQFEVAGVNIDGTQVDLTSSANWTSSNPAVVGVTGSGLATPLTSGVASVQASADGLQSSALLTVGAMQLQSIEIVPSTLGISLGSHSQLVAIGTYNNAETKDVSGYVDWSSLPAGIAQISSSGMLTPLQAGSGSITASLGSVATAIPLTVNPAPLVAIDVTTQQPTVPLGESAQFTATGHYADGGTADLTATAVWTSSLPSVAPVTGAGLATGAAQGTTSIAATVGTIKGQATLQVSAAALASLSITSSASTMPVGESFSMRAIGRYTDGSTQDVTNIAAWSSQAPGIIAITAPGLGVGQSTGTVVVSAAVGPVQGSTSLSVSAAILVSLSVRAANSQLPLGGSLQLAALGTFSDGSVHDLTNSVAWSSSAPGVVSVTPAALATATAPGQATATAASAGILGSVNLSVTPAALTALAIQNPVVALQPGAHVQLTALGTFTDGSTRDVTNSIQWNASPATVMTIDNAGIATATGVGIASVTASGGNVVQTLDMNVASGPLSSIAMTPGQPTVSVGVTLQLSLAGTFEDGSVQLLSGPATWSIASPQIAAIDSGGAVTGLQPGTTRITATVSGVSANGTLTVLAAKSVAYFSADPVTDSTIRIANPGFGAESLCAMVFVFDGNQQMSECCGCSLPENALLTLSLANDLNANPLTGVPATNGTIVVVPSAQTGSTCNAGALAPSGTALAWATHVQSAGDGTSTETEVPFTASPVSQVDASALQSQCSYIQQLGSGQGICGCGSNP